MSQNQSTNTEQSNINFLLAFLIIISGASIPILKRSDCAHERGKYATIGATMLLTATFASLSGGYALFIALGLIDVSLLFGGLWGIFILLIDRLIVGSIRKNKNNFFEQIKVAIPRLFLASAISFVITKPLELKLFEKEIKAAINTETIAEIDRLKENSSAYKEKQQLTTQNGQLQTQLKQLDRDWKIKADEANREAEGTAGTGRVGKGIVWEQKQQQTEFIKSQIDDLRYRIEANQKRINELTQKLDGIDREINPELKKADGLLKQLTTLEKLAQEDPIVKQINLAITLLFITLEISPILSKILSRPGVYDAVLEQQESIFLDEIKNDLLAAKEEIQHKNTKRKEVRDLYDTMHNTILAEVIQTTAQSPELTSHINEIVAKMLTQIKARIIQYSNEIEITAQEIEAAIAKVKPEVIKETVKNEVEETVKKAQFQKELNNIDEYLNNGFNSLKN